MDFNKYIKYKRKYLQLKYSQQKGGSKIYGSRTLKKDSDLTNKKQFLVVVPAGDSSYHSSWNNSPLFDLFVIYYGNNPQIESGYRKKANFFIKRKGPKWQLIRYVFTQFDFDWHKYQYIWLPDDDLKISRHDVGQFLTVSQKLQLKLSQPSLNAPGLPIEEQLKIINDWNSIKQKSKEYVGWLNYYKNTNKFTDIISKYISYKILLQQHPKKEKKIRYTTFIEIMCLFYK